MEQSIIKYIEQAIRENWEELALTDFNGVSFQYRTIARKIAKLHIAYETAGIKKGDKIALCGRNSAQWSIAFLASLLSWTPRIVVQTNIMLCLVFYIVYIVRSSLSEEQAISAGEEPAEKDSLEEEI